MKHSNPRSAARAARLFLTMRPGARWSGLLLASFCLLALLFVAPRALAAPQAHLLRIDPRASQETGSPVITTVVEVVQTERVSEATAHCAHLQGDGLYRCMSEALLKPNALYQSFDFPEKNAILTVEVDGADQPAEFISEAKWGESLNLPDVGTAWLIMIDADSRMKGLGAAKSLAKRFISTMGAHDIVNVMFFNDRAVFQDSKWLSASQKAQAEAAVDAVGGTSASSARSRRLASIIEQGVTDAFSSLGNAGQSIKVPLHQAVVVLSSGYGGADPSTTGPGAHQLRDYLTAGRFPKDNSALPKTPLPVISVWFPPNTFDEFKQNSMDFMENLANPEIGGFFTVMMPEQGENAGKVVNAVRSRFGKMAIVKWRVSCLSPGVTQSFKLVFQRMSTPIIGDNSFKEVPMGIDPRDWPLDVNVKATREAMTEAGGVHPGGRFKVFGNFCWGNDPSRATAYFLPADQAPPETLAGASVEEARRAQQQLDAMGLRGKAIEVTDTVAEFEAPDTDKMLLGTGDLTVARVILVDTKAQRSSGVTAGQVLELPATTAPLPLLWILSGSFALIVLVLLVLLVLRARPTPALPPPAPVVAGYGAVPYGAPAPYVVGGHGGSPPVGHTEPEAPPPLAAPVELAAADTTPQGGFAPVTQWNAGALPGQVGPQKTAPGLSPFAQGGTAQAPALPLRAMLFGPAGTFTIPVGAEARVGRDPAQCAVLLSEPRVSGVHASVKLENGQFFVRDESSNNGTFLNGTRLGPGVWNAVAPAAALRFGPVEFSLRIG